MNTTATKTVAALTLALSLAAAPLAGCGAQPTPSGTATSDAAAQATAASVDVSGWKTLGDALATSPESLGTASNDEYFIGVYETGDGAFFRVVATMEPEVDEQLGELDFSDDDYDKQFAEVAGGLELVSAEDITDDLIPQEELDALVGKTGQQLIDEGFAFDSYYFYGGDEECGAEMDKGPFSYGVTFAATVTEEQYEDEGASIMDAKAKSAERIGVSDSVLDPYAVD